MAFSARNLRQFQGSRPQAYPQVRQGRITQKMPKFRLKKRVSPCQAKVSSYKYTDSPKNRQAPAFSPRSCPSQSSVNSNNSSTVTWNTFAISIASFSEGLYFPFSRCTIVSRLAFTISASSLCFYPAFSLYSLTFVFSAISNSFAVHDAEQDKAYHCQRQYHRNERVTRYPSFYAKNCGSKRYDAHSYNHDF